MSERLSDGAGRVGLTYRSGPLRRGRGRCVGGGVGLAAAVDYAIAVQGADVKLSELSMGIGPFVVGPAIERKIGNLTLEPTPM